MIDIHAANEYGTLRTVVMRYAGPPAIDLSALEAMDPVLRRQLETSDWAWFDDDLVRSQQESFIAVLRSRGVKVLMASQAQGCYAQHYVRDAGFVIDDVFVVARLNSAKRQGEVAGIRMLAGQMSRVVHLNDGTIEGGDVMLHENCVLVGLSEETSPAGVDALRRALASAGISREVIPISFARAGVVHLDDHLNIVAPRVALAYLPAFPAEWRRWIEREFDVVPVTERESRGVEVNAFSLSATSVVVAARSERIASELNSKGIDTIPVDYSEVTKIPGAFRCTTLPLSRDE
jgi:N-dimethylarginine dimethylaminohydrolase